MSEEAKAKLDQQEERRIEGDRPFPSVAARKGKKAGARSPLAMVGVGGVCLLVIGFLFLGGGEPEKTQDDPSFGTGVTRVMTDYSGPVYRPESPQTVVVERDTLQPMKTGDDSLDRSIARERARLDLAEREAAIKSRLADEEMQRQLLIEQGRQVHAAQQSAREMEAKRRMSSVVVLDDPVDARADTGVDAAPPLRAQRAATARDGS